MTGRVLLLASKLAVRRPRLFVDYVRAYRAGRRWSARGPGAPTFVPLSTDEFLERLGAREEGPALDRARARAQEADERPFAALAAGPSLGEIAYALVRSLRPQSVVETGVASGVTSAYVLAGLADNSAGVLHSIDLPPLALRASGGVGVSIPPALRDRWIYHWGDSRRLLPAVFEQAAGTTLFIHDSDHSYESMRWELETAAKALTPGGWLVADDAGLHSAVAEVAADLGVEPLYVEQPEKDTVTGLIRKPGVDG